MTHLFMKGSTKARVLYWKEIPAQVQTEDDDGQVSQPLAGRFQEGIDQVAMLDGSFDSDGYLDGWAWGEHFTVESTAAEAAVRLADRYNQGFPDDFVRRIRNLQNTGARKPYPGAADEWISE